MDVLCKSCLVDHLETKHTLSKCPSSARMSLDKFDTFDTPGDIKEQQFSSSNRHSNLDYESADRQCAPECVEAVDAASDEEDDDLLDYEDDEPFLTTLLRQSCPEELELEYKEMNKIQEAVATWAMKVKTAKMDMKHNKWNSFCCMSPVFPEGFESKNCNVSAICYPIVATIVVWVVFGLLVHLCLHVRAEVTYMV